MIRHEDVFKIGRLGKPHGIKGEISFQFNDDVFDRLEAEFLVVETDGILVPFFMEEYRFRSDEVALMKFEGIDTQEQARELTNSDVYFPRALAHADDLPSMAEIIGYSLVNAADGNPIGEITAIDDSTENLLFVVNATQGQEILIPAADDFVKRIDSQKREITLVLPDGLLEL